MTTIRNIAALLLLLFATFLGAQTLLKPAANTRALSISGNFNIGTSWYNAAGAERRAPFGYQLTGAPVLTVYGVQLPFSFSMSEQGSGYTQPFQQIGVSPKWKWVQLHAGFRNLQFSPYTLGGQQLLGGGVELNPGKLRAGAVYGRFRSNELPNLADTIVRQRRFLDEFERRGFAAKLGYGSADRHLDLSLLRAGMPDTDPENAGAAEQNTAIGLSGQYRFSKKLSLKTELAASQYTDAPALLADTSGNAGRWRWAGELNLNTQFRKFGLKLGFKQVDPRYRSMGCNYLQNDYRQYSLGGNFRTFKNKLILNGSVGLQTDNLDGSKPSATRRLISSVNLTLTPGPNSGVSVFYNNHGLSRSPRLPGQRTDSVLLSQVNNCLGGNFRIGLGKNPQRRHQLALNLLYNQLGSFNASIATPTNSTNLNAGLSYGFPMPAGISPNISLQWMRNSTATGAITNTGLSAGLSKAAAKGKWNNTLNASFFRNTDGHDAAGHTLQIDFSTSFQIRKRLAISAQFSYLNNRSAMESFGELLGRLALSGSF